MEATEGTDIPSGLWMLEKEVFEVDHEVAIDELLSVKSEIKKYIEAMKALKAIFDAKMVDWIEANGDITIGPIRYYVGNTKTVKTKVPPWSIVNGCLDQAFGDLEYVLNSLASSNWCRHGEVRKLCPDKYNDWFETTSVKDIKTGKPKRGLKRVDSTYLKGGTQR